MSVRDRIIALRRVRAALLRPHCFAWRTHPAVQREALAAMLREVGYAAALVVRELDDGAYEILDGHLRAELTPEQEVPVLVLDVSAADAAKIVAALDPLAAIAEADPARLAALAAQLEWQHPVLAELVARQLAAAESAAPAAESLDDAPFEPMYQIVVDCDSEAAQQTLYERLEREGYRCRVLTM
jgi:ParB-like chromosome segregation protein Spo0J